MTESGMLQLTKDDMRSLGYRIVDLLADHFEGLPDLPVTRIGSPADLMARLDEPVPGSPSPALEVLERALEHIFPFMMHTTHPRFLAFVPSPGNFVSAMADALVAGFNPFAGTWMEASGPAQVELTVLGWLQSLFELPPTAGGLFTSGGSVANLIGLAVARQTRLGENFQTGVIYMSDQTHAAVDRGLKLLGFRLDQIRRLPSDHHFQLPLDKLQSAVAVDRAGGMHPFCVVANGGTTNTGAVDPLPELAAFCQDEGLWLHADAAYGGAAILTEDGKAALRGVDQVDSLVVDPHKWLFQPYEIGCVLVRDREALRATFQYTPEYLQDLAGETGKINFFDYGVQLTRSFRAFKLWMSLQVFGLDAFRAAVGKGISLAEQAQSIIEETPDLEVVTPAQLGVVTFRYHPQGQEPESTLSEPALDRLNQDIVAAIVSEGSTMLSSTLLRVRTALRICTINPRSTVDQIREGLDLVRALGEKLEGGYR